MEGAGVMVSIVHERYLETVNGRTVTRVDLCVDTSSELPAVNALSGRTIAQGSTARVINDGTIYGFKSDGTWVSQSAGSESYSDLTDKPAINGVTLAGDKSWEDLGVDDRLSDESTNPVQNMVVTSSINMITSELSTTTAKADTATTKLTGVARTATNYIQMANGVRLYISTTEPTGNIPEGSIGIGW